MCGKQREILEHHAEVALAGFQVIDDPVADDHLAAGRLFKTADHVQRGRFAAAGRADENHELAVLDFQTDPGDGHDAGTERLHEIFKHDTGHPDSFQTVLQVIAFVLSSVIWQGQSESARCHSRIPTRFPIQVDTRTGGMLSYGDQFAMTAQRGDGLMKKLYGLVKKAGVLAWLWSLLLAGRRSTGNGSV